MAQIRMLRVKNLRPKCLNGAIPTFWSLEIYKAAL